LASKLTTPDEVIANLEKLKANSKPKVKRPVNGKVDQKGEFAYNELPSDFYKPLGGKDLSLWVIVL
jgi:hypothetical protein